MPCMAGRWWIVMGTKPRLRPSQGPASTMGNALPCRAGPHALTTYSVTPAGETPVRTVDHHANMWYDSELLQLGNLELRSRKSELGKYRLQLKQRGRGHRVNILILRFHQQWGQAGSAAPLPWLGCSLACFCLAKCTRALAKTRKEILSVACASATTCFEANPDNARAAFSRSREAPRHVRCDRHPW